MDLASNIKKEAATEDAYRRGINIMLRNGVMSLDANDVIKGYMGISGTVASERSGTYSAFMEYSTADEKITDYGCSCLSAQKHKGMCKHVIALSMEHLARTGRVNKIDLQQEREKHQEEKLRIAREALAKASESSASKWQTGYSQRLQQKSQHRPKPQRQAYTSYSIEEFVNASAARKQNAVMGSVKGADGEAGSNRGQAGTSANTEEEPITILTEPVSLTPIISKGSDPSNRYSTDDGMWSLGLRISGAGSSYMVKSVGELVANRADSALASYGKNLRFVHRRSSFDTYANALLDYIEPIVRAQDALRASQQGKRGWERVSYSTKTIPLPPAQIIRVMEIFEGRKIVLEKSSYNAYTGKSKKKSELSVLTGTPQIDIAISTDENGDFDLSITPPGMDCISDGHRLCVLEEKSATIASEEFASAMGLFLSSVLPTTRPLHILKRDMPAFCSAALESLQDYTNLVAPDGLDSMVPPEPQFSFRIGSDNGYVTCDASVDYDGVSLGLFDPAIDGQPVRDIQQELDVQQLVSSYFPKGSYKTPDYAHPLPSSYARGLRSGHASGLSGNPYEGSDGYSGNSSAWDDGVYGRGVYGSRRGSSARLGYDGEDRVFGRGDYSDDSAYGESYDGLSGESAYDWDTYGGGSSYGSSSHGGSTSDSHSRGGSSSSRSSRSVLGLSAQQSMKFEPIPKMPCFEENDDELFYALFSDGLDELSKVGSVYLSDDLRGVSIRETPRVQVNAMVAGGLLDINVESIDMTPEELIAYLASYRRKQHYVRLSNGDIMRLDGGFKAMSDLADNLGLSVQSLVDGTARVSTNRTLFVDAMLKRAGGVKFNRNSAFKQIVRDFETIADADFPEPDNLCGTLRPYQVEGYKWLTTLGRAGFGGILADDMGLGKTLQVIAYLLECKNEASGNGSMPMPALVVCPASLVYNWVAEIERFAPSLVAVPVVEAKRKRTETISMSSKGEFDILVTSYDLMRRDVEAYAKQRFSCIVLDEAQYIKNSKTKAARCAKQLVGDVRFALTGTPIENRLTELWSIFDFLMPGVLGSSESFAKRFSNPIEEGDKEAATRLQNLVGPFILRRLKSDVLKDLPDKNESTVLASMEGEQDKLYRSNAQRLALTLSKQMPKQFASERLKILAELTKLRQICCDPHLIYENYTGDSAKLETCMELVRNAVDAGHSVLLFSQFTSMLDIIETRMAKERISTLKLTGQTTKEDRVRMVRRFQNHEASVFLISLKAGGVGLNLTAADIVIHYDPWWNLAAQNQATDRAHRIGQTKEVSVFKLITKNTIEEKIVEMQERKQDLAEMVIGGEAAGSTAITRDDILALLDFE